jgi:hypothetical protein
MSVKMRYHKINASQNRIARPLEVPLIKAEIEVVTSGFRNLIQIMLA